MTIDELAAGSEMRWNVAGPDSGGVITVFFHGGRLYTYYGGDYRPADGDDIVEQSIEAYAGSGADPDVLAWLRAHGHLPG
jgi:hypothetical protein